MKLLLDTHTFLWLIPARRSRNRTGTPNSASARACWLDTGPIWKSALRLHPRPIENLCRKGAKFHDCSTGDQRMPQLHAREICSQANEVYLSVAAIWETMVKHKLGKLPLPEPPERYLPSRRVMHQIQSLPLDEQSILRLSSLPDLHRDPFDRMMICQALEHGLTLVTVDPAIKQYPVPVLV